MFRDPDFFLVAAPARWCRCCAPTRRSRSGAPAAAPARKPIRWPSCCTKRACWTRCLIYATDINPQALQQGREAGVYDSRDCAASPRTIATRARRTSLSDYYTAGYGRRGVRSALRRKMHVFSDHSLATDNVFSEVHLVSCRNVLIYFDHAAAEPRARTVRGRAVPQRLPRHSARRKSLRFTETRRRLRGVRRRSSASFGRETRSDDARIAQRTDRRVVVGGSAGAIDALSTVLPGCPPDCRSRSLIVMHLPRESPSLLTEVLQPRCALPMREAAGQGTDRGRRDLHRTARLSPAGRPWPAASRSRSTSACTFRGRRSTCCSSRPRTSTAAALLGIILSGANEDGAAGLAAVRRGGGMTVVQEPENRLCAGDGRVGPEANSHQHGAFSPADCRTARVSW